MVKELGQRRERVIARHGDVVLALAGLGLIAAGLASAPSEARIGLCSLGAGLLVLAVVLGRAEGKLKFGPVETELRRKASEEAKSVSEYLAQSGLDDLIAVAGGTRSLDDVAQPDQIRHRLSSLVQTLDRLEGSERAEDERSLAAAFLEAAHGLMADRKWSQAARFFDRYVAVEPDNWDAQYSRAVAHANSRGGPEAALAALRAYNDAIALRPPQTNPNFIARLLSYRAAMLKRLHRLDEAEADLRVAERKATKSGEEDDVRYNLACVLAMKGKHDEALSYARTLRGTPYVSAMRAHRHGYFESLAGDPEFLDLLG
jgi:tetratricopeptide (TPR) repeat protein